MVTKISEFLKFEIISRISEIWAFRKYKSFVIWIKLTWFPPQVKLKWKLIQYWMLLNVYSYLVPRNYQHNCFGFGLKTICGKFLHSSFCLTYYFNEKCNHIQSQLVSCFQIIQSHVITITMWSPQEGTLVTLTLAI